MFVVARGPWRWLLNALGLIGLTMPWRRIYLLAEHFDDPTLRRHELIHIEQMDREGTVCFCIKYLWWLARVGYQANPYEIEAYARQGDA